MDYDILDVIEEEIANNPSVEEMKALLEQKGFSEEAIEYSLLHFSDRLDGGVSKKIKRNIRLFTIKEFFDRIGYGFSTNQFVNILFYQTIFAAGMGSMALFIVGLFNALKSLLSVILSTVLQEYQKVQQLPKRLLSFSGILFGFSFLFMAFARAKASVPLFAASLIVGSIGVVGYGDIYNKLIRDTIKKERMGLFLAKISQYGVLITAVAMLLSGYLMDWIPILGRTFSIELFGKVFSFKAYGYLISFEITAFAFILSGYVLSFVNQKKDDRNYPFKTFLSDYMVSIINNVKPFFANKFIFLLTIASILGGVLQTLGNSYFGIFIYEQFKSIGFGGFLNVAVIYAIAIVVSVFGPWLTNKIHKSIGFSPMLVFGTMLIAMMPFFAAWSPNIYAITVANALSIIGSSILGVAHGLLARKLLREHEREVYFSSVSIAIVFPYLFLSVIGAFVAHVYGLTLLFKVLVFGLLVVVVPLYIILVVLANKRRL